MLNINDYKTWHFVGVGGVSMSKLCAYLATHGFACSGSDAAASDNLAKLGKLGVAICIGVDVNLAKAADIVVYSAAIPSTHPERACAKLAIERKELLAAIESLFKMSIAVSGAHGKTTVSGMLSFIMKSMGLDALPHVGGEVIGMNAFDVPRNNDYIVIEACEYSRSFLELNPDFGIIVNIDYDHPDCYRDLGDTYAAFAEFLTKIKSYALIDGACKSRLLAQVAPSQIRRLQLYTFGDGEGSDYYPCNTTKVAGGYTFDVMAGGKSLGNFYLVCINAINVKCATIAIAACDIMHFPMDKVNSALRCYKGVGRRMEYLGDMKIGAAVYTDYAHHPQELTTLCANLPSDIIDGVTVIFQPHTYSRTKALLGEFIVALKLFKRVIILPTYAAREQPCLGVDGLQLCNEIIESGGKCEYFQNWEDIASIIPYIKNTDTLLLVGAGIDYMGIFQILKQ